MKTSDALKRMDGVTLWASRLTPADFPEINADVTLDLRLWASRLSYGQQKKLHQEVNKFLKGVKPEEDLLPELGDTMKEDDHLARLLYYLCLAIYQRQLCEREKQLLDRVKSPNDVKNSGFIWRFYMLLVETGQVRVSGEFLMASEKQRRMIIFQTIQHVIENEMALVEALLFELRYIETRGEGGASKTISAERSFRTA